MRQFYLESLRANLRLWSNRCIDMMKCRGRIQSYFRGVFSGLGMAAAFCGMMSCKPSAPLGPEKETVAPVMADSPGPAAQDEVPRKAPEPADAVVAPAATLPAKADASALERQFFASREPEARGAVAAELWDLNTPQAVATLQRLFNTDAAVDVKVDIVSGLIDAEPTASTREMRWSLLLTALSANQPAPVREVAVQILAGSDDPRALSALQSFSNDTNGDVREAVAAAIEDRRKAAER